VDAQRTGSLAFGHTGIGPQVVELQEVPILRSHLIGQLVLLHKRIHVQDGLLRICGLSDESLAILQASKLESRLPHFRNREEAVMGASPNLPR